MLQVPGILSGAILMPGEFLMAFSRFAQTVALGDPDHVLLGALKAMHGNEKHTRTEWSALLKSLKSLPATSGVKRLG